MHKPRRSRPSLQASKAIELKHLKSAVAAADCGSIRGAAELLRSQQSSLSRRIDEIEHHLGIAIFERYSGGVRPTRAGHDVLRLARSILEEFDALLATAISVHNSESGRLTIGFCTSLSAGNLQTSLLAFKEQFPQIELVTVERSRTRLAAALRSGSVDVLIVTGRLQLLNTEEMPLWSERVLVALPHDHPLAGGETVCWSDLRGQTVLLSHYDPGKELEDLLISKLLSPEHRPKIERHDVSRGIIKSLISMSTGISLVLESDMGANFAGLVYRELRDGTGPSRFDFSATWRPDNENPALREFLKLLTARYRSPPIGG
ncbi:LysR family transcriptional regulator [Bradyrhizobium canariense]|uniref:LysR family transcriptional regulator n=1 Tax=Bradyrhizobium canariense TaxID=255045 RepID=A0ABX3X902_9BRAD|nr:LysR family transcriptional regulator [Bradyrhizobium canariense]OSJ13479.1 LysR family transcriptional regulator [Bradyrhizobium canariense]OSJ33536.1 LysR family transcriptional regulator [Bradyrhizobium canariense]